MLDDGRETGASTHGNTDHQARLSPLAGAGVGLCALSAALLTVGAVSGALPLGPLLTWLLSLAAAGVVVVALVSVAQVRRLRAALAEERQRLRALSDSGDARSFAVRH